MVSCRRLAISDTIFLEGESKEHSNQSAIRPTSQDSLFKVIGQLRYSNDEAIRKRLQDKSLFVRDLGDDIRRIGLTTVKGKGMLRLDRTHGYN